MAACITLAEARDYIEDRWGVPLTMSGLYATIETGRGPSSFKVGHRIYLYRTDVDIWMRNQIEATTRPGVTL